MSEIKDNTNMVICKIPYTLIRCKNFKDEVLFVRRFKPPYIGKWNFLGGKIQSGESPLESACRELSEEAGINRSHKNMVFCGLAIWPTSVKAQFLGMYLFRARYGSKSNNFSQMSINGEGLYSWFNVSNVENREEFVPNLDPLLEVFSSSPSKPTALLHQVSDNKVCFQHIHEIPQNFNNIHKKRVGDEFFNLVDIFGCKILNSSTLEAA